MLLMAVAVLLGGCVTISNVQLNGNVPAGSNHQISMTLTATTDATDAVRGVIADPHSLGLGCEVGQLRRRAQRGGDQVDRHGRDLRHGMGSPVAVGHNGHKDGYKWWVGYSGAQPWATGMRAKSTYLSIPTGVVAPIMLDFATGWADEDDPEDVVNDKGFWQVGSAGPSPTGVLLDQAITLYCFTDVTPGVNYYEAIQGMGAKGLIQGYPTGTGGYSEFRPSNTVFRAQYAKMIDGALGLVVDEAMPAPVSFADLGLDLPADLYPHEYVWVAYNNNIIKGFLDGSYRPYTAISRGHVVTMTVRALLNLHPNALEAVPDSFVQTWGNDLLPEHKATARIAEYNNLLAGLPLTTTAANGLASMPRGEVAQVLWNMMGLIAP